jgi:6,7-dimethyl-8-ribityllumazine synthase
VKPGRSKKSPISRAAGYSKTQTSSDDSTGEGAAPVLASGAAGQANQGPALVLGGVDVDCSLTEPLRIGIVVSEWNSDVTERLLEGALAALHDKGIDISEPGRCVVVRVPGAFELPQAAKQLAESGAVDTVVALGCVIRGETDHYLYVAAEAARGLQQVALSVGVPVTFGVLTTDTVDQALRRAEKEADKNKGYEAAVSALAMGALFRQISSLSQQSRTNRAAEASEENSL